MAAGSVVELAFRVAKGELKVRQERRVSKIRFTVYCTLKCSYCCCCLFARAPSKPFRGSDSCLQFEGCLPQVVVVNDLSRKAVNQLPEEEIRGSAEHKRGGCCKGENIQQLMESVSGAAEAQKRHCRKICSVNTRPKCISSFQKKQAFGKDSCLYTYFSIFPCYFSSSELI